MTTKCANPACNTSFRYFRGGRLFLVEPRQQTEDDGNETKSRRSEYFWLCESCAAGLTVTLGRNGYPHLQLRHAA